MWPSSRPDRLSTARTPIPQQGCLHARPMTPTQLPRPSTVPGFVVLDLDLPDRPPLRLAAARQAYSPWPWCRRSSTTSSTPTPRAAAGSDPRAHRRGRHHRPALPLGHHQWHAAGTAMTPKTSTRSTGGRARTCKTPGGVSQAPPRRSSLTAIQAEPAPGPVVEAAATSIASSGPRVSSKPF